MGSGFFSAWNGIFLGMRYPEKKPPLFRNFTSSRKKLKFLIAVFKKYKLYQFRDCLRDHRMDECKSNDYSFCTQPSIRNDMDNLNKIY